jgi:regulator of protease activity HflC (stomatin/prohibitin superfamily)
MMLDMIFGIVGVLAFIAGAICFVLVILARGAHDGKKAADEGRFIRRGFFLLAIGIICLFIPTIYVIVDAGVVGVSKTFGVVDEQVFEPGLHLKSPFTEVIPMSTRTQKYLDYGSADKATIIALSNDGLSTSMGIAVNYHLNPDKIPDLYKQVGTEYSSVVMVNPIHSVPRDLISKYDTKTLYSASKEGSTDRAKLEAELYTGITQRLNEVGVRDSIIIEQVSIRDIDFPPEYKNTITAKMNMDTEIATKKSELEKQRIEAERIVVIAQGEASANIERAKGEAEANRIRTESLSPILLDYTWIQGMLNNKNAVYIPTGEDGLPLFKNVDQVAANP